MNTTTVTKIGCVIADILSSKEKTMVGKFFVLLAIVSLAWLAPAPANAGLILFSNFSPADGNGFNMFSGISVDGPGSEYNAQAMPFTPSATSNLESIDIALFWSNFGGTTTTGIVRVYNADGLGGLPGSVIESFNVNPPEVNSTPTHVTSSLNPLLASGTQYWLAALPFEDSSGLIWYRNSSGQTGIPAHSGDGTTWTAAEPPPQDLMAFRVIGTVPEPSSFTLLAVAAAMMAGHPRLRARKKGR